MITSTAYNQVPPKVEYSLSEYGKTLGDVLDMLFNRGKSHINNLII
ncbi:MAG: winged helix-turn-helix transcriptional regulator [Clostridium sp.]|nr:winged helix-turn-helix transcriptional regulator [Clostridium sp.]